MMIDRRLVEYFDWWMLMLTAAAAAIGPRGALQCRPRRRRYGTSRIVYPSVGLVWRWNSSDDHRIPY